MKKFLALALSAALLLSGCGSSASQNTETAAEGGSGAHIYVLTAAEDHGWTGSVATFAKEKAEEVRKSIVYGD